jgi:hypothetical protein
VTTSWSRRSLGVGGLGRGEGQERRLVDHAAVGEDPDEVVRQELAEPGHVAGEERADVVVIQLPEGGLVAPRGSAAPAGRRRGGARRSARAWCEAWSQD